jgi:hypothetical protein
LAASASDLIPLFRELSTSSDLTFERALMKVVEKERNTYEKLVISALKVRKQHTETEVNIIVRTRSTFELSRFDLVRRLNHLDTQKKARGNAALNF